MLPLLRDDLRRRLADALRPAVELWPDEWAIRNRAYPPSSGRPGPRDPFYTPYMVAFGRSVATRQYRRVVMVVAAQAGKSESLLDIIGQRFDQRPAPVIYCGPTQRFVTEQWEPRIMQLLDEAPRLASKVARGKRMTKTRKVIAGNPLRLAHGGSSASMKSDPAALVVVDEADELLANVKGAGNPIALVEARLTTVADGVLAVVSTPSEAEVEVEIDPASNLRFWKRSDPKSVASAIWKLFDQGTRRHWAWPCPACGVYFVPRFDCVEWPDGVVEPGQDGTGRKRKLTVAEIERAAFMRCPNEACRFEIHDDDDGAIKAEMNRRGRFVCWGQAVTTEGEVVGPEPDSKADTFWASGLCSPFKSWGERASAYAEAARSGDSEQLRVVTNASFGECWSPRRGDAPAWTEVFAHRSNYRLGDCPDGVKIITSGADVQRDRIVFTVRGWGVRQESWLLDYGECWGDTATDQPWSEFAEQVLDRTWGAAGLMIKRCFVDSGFRPGGTEGPVHAVYTFARQHQRVVAACKGYASRQTPVSFNRIEVAASGVTAGFGLQLARLDSDFLKNWVHDKVRAPVDAPGAWHIPEDISEDYCKQLVSEARTRTASGAHSWVRLSKANHGLDCEAMAYGAAWAVGVQRIQDRPARPEGPRRNFGSLGANDHDAEPRVFKPNEAEPPRRRRLSDIGKSSNVDSTW